MTDDTNEEQEMTPGQSARWEIRNLLHENMHNEGTLPAAVVSLSANILLQGAPGMTLAEQRDCYLELKRIRDFFYPKGSEITVEEAEAFILIDKKVKQLDPNPEVDLDALEKDFQNFFTNGTDK